MSRKLSFTSALFWIVASLFCVTGGTCKYVRLQEQKRAHPSFIYAIIQTGPQREALKTVYLAELLNLSWDRP